MDNSIYVALSRQIGQFRDLNVTANNLANVNTTGYQAEKLMFTDFLTDDGHRNKIAFTQDIASYRDTNPGSMTVTENALDVSLRGNGYFTVRTPQGDRYTRAGNFQLDGEGVMITADGYPVLDAGGQEIQFDDADREIRVLQTGAVVVDGEERAILGTVAFGKDQELERVGRTLFTSKQPPQPVNPEDVQVLHGVIENSNVSPVLELVKLTELSRSTANTAKLIETLYDLERKTSNTWTQQA